MGFLKRTNKKFDYQPRYYKGEGNPFKIEHKLDKFRTTTGKNKGLKFLKKTTRHFFVVFWQQSQYHTGRRTRHRVFILSCLSCFVVFALLIKIGFDLKQRLYICRR